MLATGLAGTLVRSPWAALLLLLHSTMFMAGLLLIVWGWFAVAAAAAQPGSAQRRRCSRAHAHHGAVVLLPLHCARRDALPDRMLLAEALYASADLGAKAVWAALLMQGNALVAESQRRSREYLARRGVGGAWWRACALRSRCATGCAPPPATSCARR
jgi:hypothetical protein